MKIPWSRDQIPSLCALTKPLYFSDLMPLISIVFLPLRFTLCRLWFFSKGHSWFSIVARKRNDWETRAAIYIPHENLSEGNWLLLIQRGGSYLRWKQRRPVDLVPNGARRAFTVSPSLFYLWLRSAALIAHLAHARASLIKFHAMRGDNSAQWEPPASIPGWLLFFYAASFRNWRMGDYWVCYSVNEALSFFWRIVH